jgi:hypothetical protein
MVKVFVYSRAELFGWADLTKTDPPMGCASGVFHPNESYKKIQPLIREHHLYDGTLGKIDNEMLSSIQCKLSTFDLKIETETGERLYPIGGIHFVDFTGEIDSEPIQLDVLGLDHQIFNQLFPGEYQKYEEQFRQS